MDKKNSEGSYGNFNAPNSPVSSAAPSLAHACQSQTLNLGFLINDTDDVNQNQLDSPSSPAAHDDSIDSTINFCELNQFSVAFSENSLEHESTSQASLEVHYNSSPKPTTYSLPPGQSLEPWDQSLNGEISSGESKCSNTVRGKSRKPSTKRKHPEETSHDVVNGEINDGEHTGQSQQHEQKCRVRTSKYRGVSRGNIERYEAFLWDNSDPHAKPKTVYVGGFADEEAAARAYDLAALKIWGLSAQINFPLNEYEKDLEEMKNMNKKEYLATLRRKSKGFSKGVSIYRGVSRNPKYNKWQARLGKGKDTKGIYLGTFESEEEAAKAYDVAAIRVRGMKAFTNFNIREYNVKSILESAKLPIGNGISKFLKENSVNDVLVKKRKPRKLPILNLEEQNTLSSSQANPPLQSSAEEENIQNQLNDDDISCGVEHNPNSFPVHGQQNPAEFQTNPSSDTPLLGKNLAVIENGENSISGLLSGFEDSQHSTAPQNEKLAKHVLHEYPSSSLIKSYQHPSSWLLQAHQNDFRTFLTGDGDGNAFQINVDLSGNIEQGVSSDEVLVGNTTLTDTNQSKGRDFFQETLQIAPCENFLQLLGQQNQDSLFHLNESDNHQNHDFEANSSLLRGLTEIDFRENSKNTYEGEISSVGILKGNSAVVETEKNINNGGSNERRFPSKRQGETIGGLFKDVEDDDLNSFSSWLEMELMEKN